MGLNTQDYFECIKWRSNLFRLPRCNASNQFIAILADLFLCAANSADLENDSLQLATIFSQVIRQNIGSKKVCSIRKTLERRLRMWHNQELH
ncbi:hypothetical protein GJ496_011777 [Pomphorhynchus laevis]|nr:hypothetical protein GJ496_011777 [Pomphorhynchus laevis]